MTLKEQYEFLVFLLLAILVLELVARRLGLPPAASFIVGGMALAFVPGVPDVEINPDLIMVVFLPPLLMSSSYFTIWEDFKKQVNGIVSLAFGAVIFTTLAVAAVLHIMLPELPLAVGFALGAIVSPPDAVAASAVLSKISLPGRLVTLLEGESLVNDATGLVLFAIAVGAAVTGKFDSYDAVFSFFWLSVSGGLAGAAMGWLGMRAIRLLKETELVITATLLLSTTSYVAAEAIGGSGVLAVVATGLIVGGGHHDSVSAATRVRAQSFWRALVFIMESLLFVLIGLSLRDVVSGIENDASTFSANVLPLVAVVSTVIVARFVWVAGCAWLITLKGRLKLGRRSPITGRELVVVGWSGMRGVVTLSAALAYPADLPGRDLVLVAAFSVIVVTVLVQGSTLAGLARLLGVADPEERQTLMKTKAAVRLRLANLHAEECGAKDHPKSTLIHRPLELEHLEAAGKLVSAARAELLKMFRRGEIHEKVLRDIEHELDLEEMTLESRARK
ncbi:sodium:proton antiporter [Rhizobium leguminosarum]|uniref:cation:proton antiporter n=1 Tax=Rhizobium leguminosarum TaxID=384 RepID=UPI001C900303|nr:sodium:proton antiporter [Rhizobium leguminosarum]MBY3179977.1 sodium:proton antiporter [Rhizobium leguminosarum]